MHASELRKNVPQILPRAVRGIAQINRRALSGSQAQLADVARSGDSGVTFAHCLKRFALVCHVVNFQAPHHEPYH
jgi:hypothetical protein